MANEAVIFLARFGKKLPKSTNCYEGLTMKAWIENNDLEFPENKSLRVHIHDEAYSNDAKVNSEFLIEKIVELSKKFSNLANLKVLEDIDKWQEGIDSEKNPILKNIFVKQYEILEQENRKISYFRFNEVIHIIDIFSGHEGSGIKSYETLRKRVIEQLESYHGFKKADFDETDQLKLEQIYDRVRQYKEQPTIFNEEQKENFPGQLNELSSAIKTTLRSAKDFKLLRDDYDIQKMVKEFLNEVPERAQTLKEFAQTGIKAFKNLDELIDKLYEMHPMSKKIRGGKII